MRTYEDLIKDTRREARGWIKKSRRTETREERAMPFSAFQWARTCRNFAHIILAHQRKEAAESLIIQPIYKET